MMPEELTLSQIGLMVIVALIPIAGFVMTISHARKGETRREQRRRKSHGLLFWVMLPTMAGVLTVAGYTGTLPSIFGLIGVISLAGTTFLSWSIQQRHEER